MSNTVMKSSAVILSLMMMFESSSILAEPMDDSEVCPRAVEYSMQYMKTTDPRDIHKGVWQILTGTRTDDAQKLVVVSVFHGIQEVAWRVDDVKSEDNIEVAKFWEQVRETLEVECTYALNRIRFPDGE